MGSERQIALGRRAMVGIDTSRLGLFTLAIQPQACQTQRKK